MKCVVTGGSGFLASHVADELVKQGHEVTILDKKKSKYLNHKQKFIYGDIKKKHKLLNILKKKDILFHFAAISDIGESIKSPRDTVITNILATVDLLEICMKYKIKRFIFASTIYVNSEEGAFYKSSKRSAENFIEEYSKIKNLKFTILRFGSIFGERSELNNGVKKILTHALKKKEVRYYGSRNTMRNYISVQNAAKLTVKCIQKKYENKHVEITGRSKIKIYKLLKIVKNELNISKPIIFDKKPHLGHYINEPNTYKFKKGEKLYTNSELEFKEDLQKYLKSLRKTIKK